jgi:hypothetical protein
MRVWGEAINSSSLITTIAVDSQALLAIRLKLRVSPWLWIGLVSPLIPPLSRNEDPMNMSFSIINIIT